MSIGLKEYKLLKDIAEIAESGLGGVCSKKSMRNDLNDIAAIARGYLERVAADARELLEQEYRDKYGEDLPKDYWRKP